MNSKTKTSRPAPISTRRIGTALMKAERGFTVECTTPHPDLDQQLVQVRREERRRKEKWRYRYQIARGNRAVWSPWRPLVLDTQMIEALWRVVRKGGR